MMRRRRRRRRSIGIRGGRSRIGNFFTCAFHDCVVRMNSGSTYYGVVIRGVVTIDITMICTLSFVSVAFFFFKTNALKYFFFSLNSSIFFFVCILEKTHTSNGFEHLQSAMNEFLRNAKFKFRAQISTCRKLSKISKACIARESR